MSDKPRLRGRPKDFYDKSRQSRIQAIDRALDVLELLAGEEGLTLSEISEKLGQSAATIHRVLSTLQARQAVEMDTSGQLWHIGAGTFRLGTAFLRRNGVVDRARPFMRQLMAETGETSNLGIEKADRVLFVSQVETHEAIRAFFPPGTQSPMHASGIGKALLAYLPEERVAAILKRQALERFTQNTIVEPPQLKTELAQIRAQGFAFDDEEKAVGMRCIAAPVLNVFGEVVAGISVSGPSSRMRRDRIAPIGALVADVAAQLSRNLGAR